MTFQIGQSRAAALIITGAALVVIIAGLRAAAPLVVPFFLAAFIAIISAPPLFWLRRKGVPALVAIGIIMAALLVLFTVLATLIGTSLDNFLQDMPMYQQRLQEQFGQLFTWLGARGVQVNFSTLLKSFDPGVGIQVATGVLSGLGSMLSNGFLIMLTVIFILLEAASFSNKLGTLLDDPERSFARLRLFFQNIQRYMAIKTAISLGNGITVTIWLAIIGVDYCLLWGLLAFLLNYIPNIGSILAAVPAVALALVQLGPGSALLAVAGYLAVNLLMDNIIEPRVMGKGLDLSALVVFLSLVFWGWLFGPVGMILSVPLTMTAKIALEGSEETRWLATLLGTGAG